MAKKAKIKPRANSRERQAPEARVRRLTMVTFTAEDLNVLAKVLAAGQVMLPTNHPVLWRLKAAMTRMRVVVPRGVELGGLRQVKIVDSRRCDWRN